MNREERIGMNEAVFRDVNERIQEVADAFQLRGEPLDLICECGDASCVDRINVSRSEYEEIRSDSHAFAVAPGHEAPDVEEIVAKRGGFDIVRKFAGVPERIARETDPRSND
ncbi:MAG: hypothetical protein ACJ74L_08315 [Gaiellaceae bacterium]